jgi:hypothetical protein
MSCRFTISLALRAAMSGNAIAKRDAPVDTPFLRGQ